MKLGEILLRRNLISQQELEQILTQQPLSQRRIGDLLLEQAAISEQDLNVSLLEQWWRNHGFWVID
jgi:N-acetylglucosaminyldiphosphoundecaprenol N-acetyl-beta-D-mannosaminyltransferase